MFFLGTRATVLYPKYSKVILARFRPWLHLEVHSAFVVLSNELERDWLMQQYRFATVPLLRHLQWRSKRYCGKWSLKLRAAPEPCDILWAHYLDSRWYGRVSVAYQLLLRSLTLVMLGFMLCSGIAISWMIWWQTLEVHANLAMKCSIWSVVGEVKEGTCQCFCVCPLVDPTCETWKAPLGVFANWVVSRSASNLLQLVCAMAYQMVEIHLSILARKWTDDSVGSDTKCFSIVSGAWFVAFEVDMVLWNTRSSSGWRKCMASRFGLLFVCLACNSTLVSQPLANSRDLPTMHWSDQPTLDSLETICIVGISEAENQQIFDMVSFRQSICLMVSYLQILEPLNLNLNHMNHHNLQLVVTCTHTHTHDMFLLIHIYFSHLFSQVEGICSWHHFNLSAYGTHPHSADGSWPFVPLLVGEVDDGERSHDSYWGPDSDSLKTPSVFLWYLW